MWLALPVRSQPYSSAETSAAERLKTQSYVASLPADATDRNLPFRFFAVCAIQDTENTAHHLL